MKIGAVLESADNSVRKDKGRYLHERELILREIALNTWPNIGRGLVARKLHLV